MSAFKAQVTADLSTFLNVDEFADTVEIDGVAVACVLDEAEAPKNEDGVAVLESTLYARSSDIAAPVVDQRMTIGARQAMVTHVDEAQGMRIIRLRWWTS